MNSFKWTVNNLASRLVSRNWPQDAIDKYMGHFADAYLAYAQDETLRVNAASGAAVSAILIHLLETGIIDGALVCRTIIRNGHVRGEFFVARCREDVVASQGSKYVTLYFVRDALPLIDSFQGKMAIVGLPCHVDIMRRRMKRVPSVGNKVRCLIALICGHSSEKELVDNLTEVLENEAGSKLKRYDFRRGHWRGKLCANFEDGSQIEHPYSRFGLYQNLYFWSEKKCFQCHDHFGYNADLSAGDVWSFHLRNDPIKYTCILTRTEQGKEIFGSAVSSGALCAKTVPAKELLDGQARTAPFHYNLSARIGAARLHGLKLKDTVREPISWNHRMVAHMALFNWRWSKNEKWSRLIFKIPKPILKAYLYLFKFLESF